MADTMTLREVRDLLYGAQQSSNLSRVSLHVTRARQAVAALDAILASQPAEQPRGEPVVNRQDIRSVCRAIDGLKDRLFDANALDAEALALHKAGCDAILRIGDVARESAQPKPEQAAPHDDPFAALAKGIARLRGSGEWRPCSGCHDTEDGHPTARYAYSRVLGCELGSGCRECGGMGVVWLDFSHYETASDDEPEQAVGDGDRCVLCGKPPLPTDFKPRAYSSAEQLLLHMGNVIDNGFPPPINLVIEWRDAMGKMTSARPTVATPAEVTDEMCSAAIIEFNKPSKGFRGETLRSMARRCLRAALKAQYQVRKDGQGLANQAEDEAFDDGEQVAQWLYRNGMRNAAFVVRGQLDVRNSRIRKLEAALASPSAGAVVPERWLPIDTAPKSTADGTKVNGIYLLGFIPDPEEDFDRQALIDIIWWEPFLRNNRGERGVWRRSAGAESVNVEPTHWMHLPAAPEVPRG